MGIRIKRAVSWIKENPALVTSTAGLGLSAASLRTSLRKTDSDKDFQREQLRELRKLTNSLGKVDKSLTTFNGKVNTLSENTTPTPSNIKKSIVGMIKFKKKEFSHLVEDSITGAKLGASIGGAASASQALSQLSGHLPKFISREKSEAKIKKDINSVIKDSIKSRQKFKETGLSPFKSPSFRRGSLNRQKALRDQRDKLKELKPSREKNQDYKDSEKKLITSLAVLCTSTVVGAALGALVGATRDMSDWISKRGADDREMKKVIQGLQRARLKEGQNFTRDPKTANLLKTKVCIVFHRDASEFKAVINSVDDSRLKVVLDKTIKKVNPGQVKNSQASNRFNEVTLSTVTNPKDNAKMIVDIVTLLSKEGYPVYLVEVG